MPGEQKGKDVPMMTYQHFSCAGTERRASEEELNWWDRQYWWRQSFKFTPSYVSAMPLSFFCIVESQPVRDHVLNMMATFTLLSSQSELR